MQAEFKIEQVSKSLRFLEPQMLPLVGLPQVPITTSLSTYPLGLEETSPLRLACGTG
jgi:hypothetical protein